MEQNVHKKFTARQNEVRLFILEFTVSEGQPFNLDADKDIVLQKLNMVEEEYREIIEVLKAKDGMVASDKGDVNFIYPVSAMPTNHRVTLADGRSFTAMCAIDAMGAAFTFHQNTEVHSVSAVSGEPVYVKIVDGKVAEYSPKTLHALTFPLGQLSNWAGSCWNVMNFFCSAAEFDQYVEQMGLDPAGLIKADIDVAIREAKATFEV